ncbi:hypothetical protein [Sphingomonas sp. Ag1]|jgi:hypothetical protein|uniref:hypothetical protein n=1 Tax=Sphingomonas sp. Ag1 TaxID=1642949 RepID=UPI00069699D6|nr:hypothetical protein [Sphingomonas sp. Ag1]
MLRVAQAIVAVAAITAMAACAFRPREVAVAVPQQAPAPVPVYATPPITPINRGLSPAATVWHMRVALNVAALACRGGQEAAIVQRYNRMLATHKATLASAAIALEGQYRASGGDWQDRYDDAMTRLYNFFSQAQVRDAFCNAAAATLTESERLMPDELQAFAGAVLPRLDAPFAEMLAPRPVIALAAPVPRPLAAGAGPPNTLATPTSALRPAAVLQPDSTSASVGTQAVAPTAVATLVATAGAPVAASRQRATAAPAVGTRAPATRAAPAPAVGTRAPWIQIDDSVLRN